MRSYYCEAHRFFRLAVPVIIAQLAQTALGMVDALMCGQVSQQDLAAIGIAFSVWTPVLLFGHGLILSLSPIVAQLSGAQERNKIAPQVMQALWLAVFIAIPTIAIIYYIAPWIAYHPTDPRLSTLTIGYLRTLIWGAPGYFLFLVMRCLNDGLSDTKPGMMIALGGLVLNVPINYIFIYGHLGAPALGVVGCGCTTAILNWLMGLVFCVYTLQAPSLRDLNCLRSWAPPSLPILWRLIKLGFPIGLAYFFETSLFSLVGRWLAPLSCEQIASHVIALSYSSLVFVLPLSIGLTATIRVGHSLGEGSLSQARTASNTALLIGFGLAATTAIFTLLFRKQIAYWSTPDQAVVQLVEQLMYVSAIFQCADGLQIAAAGVLRGYKDTPALFICTVISYWGVGLTSSYLLGMTDYLTERMGVVGCWIGFTSGIATAAVLLTGRIYWLQKCIGKKGLLPPASGQRA